jgi:hypothetical protein
MKFHTYDKPKRAEDDKKIYVMGEYNGETKSFSLILQAREGAIIFESEEEIGRFMEAIGKGFFNSYQSVVKNIAKENKIIIRD